MKLTALLAGGLLRAWLSTLEYRFRAPRRGCNPLWADRPTLFVFWHEMLLFPAYSHVHANVATLISQHRDGELLAQMVRLFRGKVVRGSTSRESVSAIRRLIRQGRISHLAIAPDGPLGPRRVVQSGAVFLASRAKMPIVPVGFAFRKCWRVPSWDRMALPRPWEAARCVAGEPMEVPPDLNRDQIEAYVRKLQSAIDRVQVEAENLVRPNAPTEGLLSLAQVRSSEPLI